MGREINSETILNVLYYSANEMLLVSRVLMLEGGKYKYGIIEVKKESCGLV